MPFLDLIADSVNWIIFMTKEKVQGEVNNKVTPYKKNNKQTNWCTGKNIGSQNQFSDETQTQQPFCLRQ